MARYRVPFNRPAETGQELEYLKDALAEGHTSGNGPFTQRCQGWLEARTGARRVLLTHSCTGALELSALLLDLEAGDEVIMPSFTFVSTANAFALRGAVPVFVDIRPDTKNLDESQLEAAITDRTRAICPVHYAGVGCEMDAIVDVAERAGVRVVEDAAQGVLATYRGKPLGSIGALGALSFHETKNVHSGEGGALLLNDEALIERAEVLWEKGTNRGAFSRGEVDKYTWVDLGSSFLPSELVAAFLLGQLEHADHLIEARRTRWAQYHQRLEEAEAEGLLSRPITPEHVHHNGHMYYVMLRHEDDRARLISAMRTAGILAVFHYVPLHSSPAGRRLGRASGDLPVTDDVSRRLLRLPMWAGLPEHEIERVTQVIYETLRGP